MPDAQPATTKGGGEGKKRKVTLYLAYLGEGYHVSL